MPAGRHRGRTGHLSACYDDAYYGANQADPAIGYQDYHFTAEHGLSWAAAMVRLIKSSGRVLDIGCADGTSLAKLPDSFEPYGIEVKRADGCSRGASRHYDHRA